MKCKSIIRNEISKDKINLILYLQTDEHRIVFQIILCKYQDLKHLNINKTELYDE